MKTWNIRQEDMDAYLKVCKDAAENDEVFETFKRNPAYTKILEHTSKGQGQIYWEYLKTHYKGDLFYPMLLKEFSYNDTYGLPRTYQYEGWQFSPTTLQYIYVLGRIQSGIKDIRFDGGINVIEIGGGYGGQCKIFCDFYFKRTYSIVDLPHAGLLQKKYLSKFNIPANIYEPDLFPLDKTYDLVISNYALSEVTEPLQTKYVRDILLKSTYGYITCNGPIHAMDELRDKFPSLKILPDIEGEREENFIITW
jgi:putative sugar O-methyltransferase